MVCAPREPAGADREDPDDRLERGMLEEICECSRKREEAVVAERNGGDVHSVESFGGFWQGRVKTCCCPIGLSPFCVAHS